MTSHVELMSTLKAALTELAVAAQGGDDGLGGLAELLGSEQAARAMVNAVGAAGELLAVLA